jgi:hypothetical protein
MINLSRVESASFPFISLVFPSRSRLPFPVHFAPENQKLPYFARGSDTEREETLAYSNQKKKNPVNAAAAV